MAFLIMSGLPELDTKMAFLSTTGQKRASRKAIRAGGMEIKRAIEGAAPVGKTGNLRDSTGFRFIKSTDKDPVTMVKVGPGVGKRPFKLKGAAGSRTVVRNSTGPHAPLVILGTKMRVRDKKGIGGKFKAPLGVEDYRDRSTGQMTANPYVVRAMNKAGPLADYVIEEKFRAEIKSEWDKQFGSS